MVISRFTVWLVTLDPTRGSEIAKTRPCVIISPGTVYRYLNTVMVAPLTITRKPYPTRVDCEFNNREGQIALDQISSVDKVRLQTQIGVLDDAINQRSYAVLMAMFTY